jgi:hypothetical protein
MRPLLSKLRLATIDSGLDPGEGGGLSEAATTSR